MADEGLPPDRWRRIEALFEQVVDLPPGEQADTLARTCGDDHALHGAVLRLLERDRERQGQTTPWIGQLIDHVASRSPLAPLAPLTPGSDAGEPEPDNYAGRRIGAYRIQREVGRGGQAVVFEAVREDDEFQQRVAIKVPLRGAYSHDFLQRFRHERQILAQLQHPHIARLLDGGATPEGLPFFAMEFVEGVPIRQYVADHHLSVGDRVGLFLQACEAVEYAHQNLVIHRDLKPGNILVADGSVRLLDFGIAKLIDHSGGDAGQTLTGMAPVTPDYCSPEQLRGEPITTRTDVYSLGLVLFELLVGERAQQADTTSPLTLDRSICDTDVPVPSTRAAERGEPRLARQLAGDLDAIILTAANKAPARRYPSVAALADDLRRALAGEAIVARQASRWYTSTRFMRRHWKPLSAAALFMLVLLGGIAATTYQARRAERRFQQVRRIANTLMVDVQEAIRHLPGSTKAQETVLRTAVDYLDALSGEAGGDRGLQLEIARGYTEVASLAYSFDHPSLERPEEARAYLDKARAIVDRLRRQGPDDPPLALVASDLYNTLSNFMSESGRNDEALTAAQQSVAIAEGAWRQHQDDVPLLYATSMAYNNLVTQFEGSAAASAALPRLLEIVEELGRRDPDNVNTLAGMGVAYAQAGKLADAEQRLDDAVRYYRRNLELQQQVVAREPDNTTAHRNLMLGWSHVADLLLGPLGSGSYTGAFGPAATVDPAARAQALEAATRTVEEAQWLTDHNSGTESTRFDLAVALGRQAPAFPAGDDRAVAVLERAIELLDAMAANNPVTARFLVEFHGSLAERHRQSGRLASALEHWRAADRVIRAGIVKTPGNFHLYRLGVPVMHNWALALADARDRQGALAASAQALTLADGLVTNRGQYARADGWPPRALQWSADVHERLGDRQKAEAVRARSREQWAALATRTDLPPDLLDEARQAIATK